MEPPDSPPSGRAGFFGRLQPSARSWGDLPVVLAMMAFAFLLGCHELFDPDVWWHVRAGQWIGSNRQVPRLDPFSFASADRAWIDLHWGFQLVLAASYRLGGVAGMILLASTAVMGAVGIGMAARERGWPTLVVAACWVPAILAIGSRCDPRPEVFTLVFLAGFLAILARAQRRPALVWSLVPIQVLWVNSHALFALGPVVLGGFLADAIARRRDLDRGWWRHAAPASVAVGLACLVNPYGWQGATFPLTLLPKVTAGGDPYKRHVAEIMSLRDYVDTLGVGVAAGILHFRATFALLAILPWSFVLPASWSKVGPARDGAWVGAALAVAAIVLAETFGLPGAGTPGWFVFLANAGPWATLAMGIAASVLVVRRSREAAVCLAIGATAASLWTVWLRSFLMGSASPGLGWAVAGFGLLAVALVLRSGGSLFRMLLAAAFVYLGLQAIRNSNLLGLVIGTVVAGNLGEWASRITSRSPRRSWTRPARTARVGLLAMAGLGIAAILTDRFHLVTGEAIRSGLRERPLTFAHDAARFCAGAGLPDRALVLDLGQTGVYLFHNGPERKIFLDSRLEVPRRSTFEAYVRVESWLNRGDPRGTEALKGMGNPLVLLGHDGEAGAEASLIADPRWRCVSFDPVASVFLPRNRVDLLARYPTVDFAARRFQTTDSRPLIGPTASLAEALALLKLAAALRRRAADPWTVRAPMLLSACDLASRSLPRGPEAWMILGNASWELIPDLSRPPTGPGEPWDGVDGLFWAQATYSFRRASEQAPRNAPARQSLARILGVRGMDDARSEVEDTSAKLDVATATGDEWPGPEALESEVVRLIRQGRPASAARLAATARRRGDVSPWPLADRVAIVLMHLGEPELARRAWEGASSCPSRALQRARVAASHFVEGHDGLAEDAYRKALAIDPGLGEAWCGLALLHVRRGQALQAASACRSGLRCELTDRQREAMEGLRALTARFQPTPPGSREKSSP